MDKKGEQRKLFDTIHQSDGVSLFDLPAILATIFSIFGSIYGFVLPWGPIIWGLIGIALGFIIGLIIKLITTKKYSDRQNKTKAPEVVLFIRCQADQIEMVKDTLWEHHALGVSRLDLSGERA